MTGPRAWLGEFVGTFAFVAIAAGSVIVVTSGAASVGIFGVAWATGLGFAIMVTVFMKISGGHLNPAITLSAWIARRIETQDAAGYVVAQIAGGFAAAGLLRGIFTEAQWRSAKLGTLGFGTTGTTRALLIEAAFSFFLVLAAWATVIDTSAIQVGGFAVGLTVFVSILVAGPLTGAVLNPARYLGPAVIGGGLRDWWVYVAGPAIGGIVASVYDVVFLQAKLPWATQTPQVPPPAVAPPEAAAPKKPARRRKPTTRKTTRGV